MSRKWTKEELAKVSVIMKDHGNLSYPEFCAELEKQGIPIDHDEIKISSRLMKTNQSMCGGSDEYR